jgi:deoxyribodipyrimidine photo-lyase
LQALINKAQPDPNLFYSLLAEGERCWLNELAWRDFYRHILAAYPRVCKGRPFKLDTDKLPWQTNEDLYQAWCQGKTGVPIVDAAMRQLNATGWMHNRLRMIVAMFLTKHLMIDWRLGEAYFYSRLADADFASNNGGWQWSASTGVDAVPYFRIFNPYRQSERFDSQGAFVRKYIKELAHVEDRMIHQPSKEIALESGYPLPIVDLKLAAEKTKSLFKSLATVKG